MKGTCNPPILSHQLYHCFLEMTHSEYCEFFYLFSTVSPIFSFVHSLYLEKVLMASPLLEETLSSICSCYELDPEGIQ